jgi:Ca-activated chloride channel homolog
MPKHDVISRRTRVYEEQFQWPLGAGIVLLFASLLIGTRRRVAARSGVTSRAKAARAAVVALACVALPSLGHASVSGAENAYKSGDYNKAETQYEDAAAQHPDNAPLQYDLGAAAYKSGEFDTALPAFQKALGSDDPTLQQKVYYNIGNTQYRVGQKTVQSTPQDTIKQWQSAVQAYDSALKLKPDDADAKFNRDFVEKKLEKLQKQQPQKKQQQDQKQQNQDQQNQQQQQQNQQNQDQQNQQNQNQQNQQQQNQQQSQSQNQQGNQGSPQNQQNGQNQAQSGSQPKDQNGQQQQQSAGNQQQQSAGSQPQNQNQNGQQQQQSAGNQQQKNDQNGQNGQQQQQTAGNQDQQKNGGQNQQQNGGDQQKQTAQNGAQQGGSASTAAGADKDKQSGQEADASLPAGELTREQAKDLLSSLKGEEHILPVTADSRSAHPQDHPVLKDW